MTQPVADPLPDPNEIEKPQQTEYPVQNDFKTVIPTENVPELEEPGYGHGV